MSTIHEGLVAPPSLPCPGKNGAVYYSEVAHAFPIRPTGPNSSFSTGQMFAASVTSIEAVLKTHLDRVDLPVQLSTAKVFCIAT
mgnify:CR=1 FL=1